MKNEELIKVSVAKADAALAALEYCEKQKIQCPWMEKGRCTVTPCPAAADVR